MRNKRLFAALAAFNGLLTGFSAAQTPAHPNIVYILADDLGYGDLGFNGGRVPTPNLDKLAGEGVQLKEFYVAPVCTPSRAGLMTGRYWTRFGVYGVQATRSLPWDTVTLPRALKSLGYDTALMGKWHLGSKPEWGPNHFGFDYSYGSLGGGVGPFNHFYKRGPYMLTWHRDNDLITEAGHVTDLIANEAVKWIDERTDKPFFLYLPFTAVHIPVKEPPEWLARVPDSLVAAKDEDNARDPDRPQYTRADIPASPEVTRNYIACIMHLDYEVGRVVAELEKTGKRQNTLIVFSSDNGAPAGVENDDPSYPADHYPQGPTPGSNRPLRGFKAGLYDGGIHVAAVANWPGVLSPRSVREPIDIVDWMPTFCALTGYNPEKDLKWDGMNVWDFLTGKQSTLVPRVLYCGGNAGKELRVGDWKLIVFKTKRGAAARTELYNLANDPFETKNLAPQMPEKVQSLSQELKVVSSADGDSKVPGGKGDKGGGED